MWESQGKPFKFAFAPPHFNAIIGGRGTGKSTVLESIRIVSHRDQGLETEAPRLKEDLNKFQQGVMLDNTEILLNLHRRGKDYQLCWHRNGQGSYLKEKINSGWNEIEETGDLKERFPISIFSQNQINELASNPRGLLEFIDPDFRKNTTFPASKNKNI